MVEATERDRPLTPAGRLFLQPPTNQVVNIAIAGERPIDVDSFKSVIQNSIMLQHPRFCSLTVRDSYGREHWRKTLIDVDRHLIIRRSRISDDQSDENAVNDYLADLSCSSPLPTDKPLWEIHLLLAHKTAVFRVHHALGDGVSLMSMLELLCGRADEPPGPRRRSSGAARRWSVWMVVRLVWYTFVFVIALVLRGLWVRDKTTAVSGGAGVELWPRRLATARFRLEDMKIVKRAVRGGATINDVLLGVISEGLLRYLDTRSLRGVEEGIEMTGLGMVDLRPLQQDTSEEINNCNCGTWWGNKFGMILLPLYCCRSRITASDPLHFVMRSKAMMDNKKLSLEALFSYKILQLIVAFFGAKLASKINYRIFCNTTFTISNITGPREEITLAGNPVKSIRLSSSSLPHAITMHMVSYAGVAEMQILVAKDIIPDPKLLAKYFEEALLQMKDAAEAQATSQSL